MVGLLLVGCNNSSSSQGGGSSDSGDSSGSESSDSGETVDINDEETKENAKEIELRYAHNKSGLEGNVIAEIVKQFEADYPNVTIKLEETPGYDHQTKIQMDASSDRMPDVFNYWRLDPAYGLDKMARAGLVADLSDFTADFKDLFDKGSWDTATLDGTVYGVPSTMFYIHILANKEVFDKAGAKIPETWDELLDANEKLKAAGFIPWGSSIKGDHGVRIFDYVFSRYLTNDRALNMFAGNEPIDVPEVLEAAKLLEQLVVGNIPQDSNAIDGDAVYAKYINAGKAGLIIDGSFNIDNVNADMMDKMEVIEFPLIPGGAQEEKAVEKDLTALIYASSKSWDDEEKRPYIEEFIKRLTNRDAGKMLAEDALLPVPHQGLDIDEEKLGRVVTKAQEIANSRPANRWLPKVMDADKRSVWEPMLTQFLNGDMTPEDFVKKMHELFYEG